MRNIYLSIMCAGIWAIRVFVLGKFVLEDGSGGLLMEDSGYLRMES